MNRPTRRGLLGGAAVLAAAPLAQAGAAQPHPDAELLALAARFIEHERLIQAMPCNAETETEEVVQDAEQRRLFDFKRGLVVQMGELRATTADGIAARARCLAVHNADGAFSMEEPASTTGRLLRPLLRDAGALGRGMVITAMPSPDAALLEACAAFDVLEAQANATFRGEPFDEAREAVGEAERERIHDEQEPYVEIISSTVATTLNGMRAKAHSLMMWAPDLLRHGLREDVLLGSLLHDLLGGEAGA